MVNNDWSQAIWSLVGGSAGIILGVTFLKAWWRMQDGPVKTPRICSHCDEPILDHERIEADARLNGKPITDTMHWECFIRMTFGSVGHQLKKCSCYGGNQEDPPGLTTREAARAAHVLFETYGALRMIEKQYEDKS